MKWTGDPKQGLTKTHLVSLQQSSDVADLSSTACGGWWQMVAPGLHT